MRRGGATGRASAAVTLLCAALALAALAGGAPPLAAGANLGGATDAAAAAREAAAAALTRAHRGKVTAAGADELFAALGTHSAIAMFHSDACPLCAAFAPELEKVAQRLGAAADAAEANATDATGGRGAGAAAGLAHIPGGASPLVFSVDVDAHGELSKTFGVRNVPHVAYLRYGRWYTLRRGEMVPRTQATGLPRYEGYLSAAPCVAWANEVGALAAAGVAAPTRPVVEELTPETFETRVLADEGTSALVAFTAAWCGHCKAFKPYLYEVGAEFADDERVLVANLDAGEHRSLALRYNVSGFPSVLLWPAGYRSRPLVFKGERKPRALMDFVRAPAAHLAEARASDALRARREAEREAEEQAARAAAAVPGVNGPGRGASMSAQNEQAAAQALEAAHSLARQKLWGEALEELVRIAETPSLRNTGLGGSPQMWNLLDNVKLNIEIQARRELGYATPDDEASDETVAAQDELDPDAALPKGYLDALAEYAHAHTGGSHDTSALDGAILAVEPAAGDADASGACSSDGGGGEQRHCDL